MVKAHPSDVTFIGFIFFMDFNYCRGGKTILVAENFAGKVRPPHLKIPSLDTSTAPPPSTLIGINESLLAIVKLLYELVYLVLRQVVFLVHLVLQHILEP